MKCKIVEPVSLLILNSKIEKVTFDSTIIKSLARKTHNVFDST